MLGLALFDIYSQIGPKEFVVWMKQKENGWPLNHVPLSISNSYEATYPGSSSIYWRKDEKRKVNCLLRDHPPSLRSTSSSLSTVGTMPDSQESPYIIRMSMLLYSKASSSSDSPTRRLASVDFVLSVPNLSDCSLGSIKLRPYLGRSPEAKIDCFREPDPVRQVGSLFNSMKGQSPDRRRTFFLSQDSLSPQMPGLFDPFLSHSYHRVGKAAFSSFHLFVHIGFSAI